MEKELNVIIKEGNYYYLKKVLLIICQLDLMLKLDIILKEIEVIVDV